MNKTFKLNPRVYCTNVYSYMHKLLPRAQVRPRGRVVSWLVCLCVHFFSACSVFSGPLKLKFSSGKVALVKKPAFLRSTYRSEHLEAQKSFFSNLWALTKPSFLLCTIQLAACKAALIKVLFALEYNSRRVSVSTFYYL